MIDLTADAALDLSVAALGRAYLVGAADPVAVTQASLERIEKASEASIFLSVTKERALKEAEAAKARYSAGRPASPVDGVPVAWKDLFDLKGEVTTAGSALFAHAPPADADSPVVAQLAAAGMVSVGKVNLTEFAFSGLGLNPHFGTCANPYDPETPRIPGGSSSGSAVAVAAGLVPVAIGSDTGGSVRVPAALNGLVGSKSSEGRIDKTAVFPLSNTLDTVGPLCRTVEDAVLLDAAMRGAVPTIARSDLAGLKVVVCESVFFDGCEDDVVDAFEAAVKRLEAAGVIVERSAFPEVAEAARVMSEHGYLVAAEAYHLHKERIDGPEVEEIDGRVVARILGGKAMSAADLIALQQARQRLIPSAAARMDGTFVINPTVPHVAPEIAPLDADPALFAIVNGKTLRNTSFGNFLSWPAVALPAASSSKLPISFQIAAAPGQDETLLSAAWAIESIVADAAA
ncbi:MAG: amidase [Pseudomonadota bacterium]